jgi:hypothetical protein
MYPQTTEIIKYSFYIANKENIEISLNRFTYNIKNSENLKEILWTLQIFKNNDLYLEYISEKFEELKQEYNKIGDTTINLVLDNELDELKYIVKNLDFTHKNINGYINKLGEKIYNILSKKIKIVVDETTYNKYFSSCKQLLRCFNKDNSKKIKFIVDKKNKIDENLLNTKYLLLNILNSIKLFDINIDKKLILDLLVQTILKGDCTYFDEIRNIFFNLIITNFSGTDILIGILERILKNTNISERAKVEIIKICNMGEFNMIKGRREINQFDMVIINIFDILKTKY